MAKYPPDKRPPPTPKQPKPWDVPPQPTRGDKTSAALFQAVGEALSYWELFEAHFGFIFTQFIGAPINGAAPAQRAYGSILTFRGRKEMVDAAAEAYFYDFPDQKLQTDYKLLVEAAVGYSARRNEIAHGIVQPYFDEPGRDTKKTTSDPFNFVLLPSRHATNKRRLAPFPGVPDIHIERPTYMYVAKDVRDFKAGFGELTVKAQELWRGLASDHRKRARQAS